MSDRRLGRRFGLFAAPCIAAMVGACGTSFPRNEPGSGSGLIYVGSPRVETGDRLINDRREKEYWLTLRRNEVRDAKLGFSGITSLSSLSFLGAQANLTLDPLRGLQNIEIGRATDNARAQAEDQRALSGLRASARDEIIAKYNKKEITFAQAEDQLKTLGLSAMSSPASAPSGTAAPPAASAPTSTLLTKNSDGLTAPADGPRASQLSQTPIQDFYDRLAAYETIQNEIYATRGDDVHDLAGNTLYRLAFDTTVFPTDDTSAWALVTVKLRPQLAASNYSALLENALQRHATLIRQTNERSYRVVMRALGRDCWPKTRKLALEAKDTEEFGVFARAFRCATNSLGSNFRAALERQITDIGSAGKLPCGESCDWLAERRKGVGELFLEENDTPEARNVFSKWAVHIGQIFDAQALSDFLASPVARFASLSADPRQPGHFPYLLKPLAGAEAAQVRALLDNLRTSVYDVAPKESVQQLSEVSANRKSAEWLLGLAASRGDIGLNAAIQSIRSNTAQYESIRRQPLIVGFTRRGNSCAEDGCGYALEFGWILGPSFMLSNGGESARFRHASSSKTVAASVSVPEWLDALGIEVTTRWIRETDVQSLPDQAAADPIKYSVRLPARYGEIFAGVGVHQEREPRVDEFQEIQVVEDAPAAVNIRGRDLWRSTAVHIGAQRADLVTIHPDRGGITAAFDKIASGSGSELKSGKAWLTLQTSEGYVLAGAVLIRPKSSPKDDSTPMKITGLPPRIVAEVQQAVELSNPLAESDEAVLQVTSPQDTSLNVQLGSTTQIAADRKNILFTLQEKSIPNLISGDVIAVSLAVKHGKSGGTEIFEIRKAVVYYKKADELKAKLLPPAKLAQVLKFKMDLPINAGLAFAAFAGGAAKLKAAVAIDGAKEDAIPMEGSCKIVAVKGRRKPGDRDTCTFELQGVPGWTTRVKKNVELLVSFVDKDAPDLDGGGKVTLAK